MELKTNYQYTYFIYPFVIKDGKYQKYILKILKDPKCQLKIFKKGQDLNICNYFLPKAREILFSSFTFSSAKLKKLEDLPLETRAAILSKYPCNIFEYQLKQDIQGKVGNRTGIFFTIQKIEIICFNTGICFLAIKTNVEDADNFANILDFNYKFRDINNKFERQNSNDNIKIQTDSFESIEDFQEFIHNITGSNTEASKLDIDTERFLTYSYACIDQQYWNNTIGFDNVKDYFSKYASVLPSNDTRKIDFDKIQSFSKWNYAKLGISKLGVMLFSSNCDSNNYTKLPEEFENQYFYLYILNLYKKIYLKKLSADFQNIKKIKKARRKFIDFTKNLWIQEITEDEIGTILNHKLQETFELEKLYNEAKAKYDTLYKELNIEKDHTVTILIAVILIISLIVNILNFILLAKK